MLDRLDLRGVGDDGGEQFGDPFQVFARVTADFLQDAGHVAAVGFQADAAVRILEFPQFGRLDGVATNSSQGCRTGNDLTADDGQAEQPQAPREGFRPSTFVRNVLGRRSDPSLGPTCQMTTRWRGGLGSRNVLVARTSKA